MSILNKEQVNHLDQPMFFGEDLGMARFESQKHRVFETLTEKQLSFFWRPEEIDLSNDRQEYEALPPHLKKIFDLNLQYQSLLDSVQGRAPTMAFLSTVSDVSLENWITTWAFSETIHSRSYTHIERNLHIDPSEQFDAIVTNEAIMKRCASITGYYDAYIEACHDLKTIHMQLDAYQRIADNSELLDVTAEHEHLKTLYKEQMRKCKVALYLCLHSVNALEAIRFYVSFSFTFNFAEEMKILEGNAKIMRLIARDETLHMKGTQSIIRLMQMGKDDPEMMEIAYQYEEEATKIFLECVQQEIEWAEYLFSHGEVDGVTLKTTIQYIHHLANQRMRAVGLTSPFKDTKDPYTWMQKYLKTDELQVAPQEVEISSYLIGQINSDVSDDAYGEWQKRFMSSGQQIQN